MKIKKPRIRQTLISTLTILSIIILLYFGLREGLRDRVDPFWLKLETILAANKIVSGTSFHLNKSEEQINKIITLAENYSPIDSIYKAIHKNATDTVPSFKLLSTPFLPDWEKEKVFRFLNPLLQKHRITISGVTGSGKTTIVDRISKLVAGSPSRILNLLCVEKMEVEYHREWIGYLGERGFVKGRLLDFFEKCDSDPNHNYIFVIDDIDKIYPATLFGSDLWSELDNPDYNNKIYGYDRDLKIPDNFYMISVTHSGVGSTIEFNNEHIRRLGEKIEVEPDYKELLLYIKKKNNKLHLPVEHIKKLIYFFTEINQYIEKNYDESYQLGQWSTINKFLKPDDFDKFVKCFVDHVNGFKPKPPITLDSIDDILDATKNNGLEPKTNFLYKAYLAMVSTGLFSEVTVALTFAIISGLFGWLFVQKKRRFILSLEQDILSIIDKFKSVEIDYETALNSVLEHKYKLEELIIKRKVNYEETSFLILFLNDQLKKVEEINKTNLVSKEFMETFERFTEDGVLDSKEYKTLDTFLNNLRNAISPEIYYHLKQKIDSYRNTNN